MNGTGCTPDDAPKSCSVGVVGSQAASLTFFQHVPRRETSIARIHRRHNKADTKSRTAAVRAIR